jgi:hypothetical protein
MTACLLDHQVWLKTKKTCIRAQNVQKLGSTQQKLVGWAEWLLINYASMSGKHSWGQLSRRHSLVVAH